MISDEANARKGHTYVQWMFSLLANVATLSYGFEVGWMSPNTKQLQSAQSPTGYPLSQTTLAWVASIMNLAAVLGVVCSRYIVDKYGRKAGLISLALPQVLSWLFKLIYPTSITLVISRIFGGLAAGGVFLVVPIYVKEISADRVRGTLSSILAVAQYVGVVVIYTVGAALEYHQALYSVVWCPVLYVVLLLRAPESPAFLVKKEQNDEAVKTLAYLRGLDKDDPRIESELEAMKTTNLYYKSLPSVSLLEILKDKKWLRATVLNCLSFTFRAWNGSLSVLTYALQVLLSTGVKFNVSPEILTISIPCIMIVSAMLLTVTVERFERKVLLSAAHFITSLSMLTLGAATMLQQSGTDVPSWLPLLAIIIALALFSGGVSQLPYIIMTEMFPFHIRASIMGVVVSYGWFLTFIITFVHPLIVAHFGSANTFLFYGGVNLLGAIFSAVCLPRTRNLTEDQIYNRMQNNEMFNFRKK